ncbi:MAG: hypothetical protein GF419_04830, partial [Ignavibacteriales bacterium]|nr:hypothetical protein [Ignavibacteriales bacterium]
MNRLLDIGKNSIMTYQYALNVSSHNITNAGDEDFSRQEANLTSYAPHAYEPYPHYWGSGAMINSLDRAYSESIDRNMREAFTSVEYNKKRSDLLALIEARVNEPGELGVSLLANEFLNSFDQLAANPTSYPLRSNVVYTAERLSDQFKHVYDGFDELSADVVHDATETVEAINRLTEKIQLTLKELNRTKNESTKRNDLLDERDTAIRELSKLAEVKVVHNEDGRV